MARVRASSSVSGPVAGTLADNGRASDLAAGVCFTAVGFVAVGLAFTTARFAAGDFLSALVADAALLLFFTTAVLLTVVIRSSPQPTISELYLA